MCVYTFIYILVREQSIICMLTLDERVFAATFVAGVAAAAGAAGAAPVLAAVDTEAFGSINVGEFFSASLILFLFAKRAPSGALLPQRSKQLIELPIVRFRA